MKNFSIPALIIALTFFWVAEAAAEPPVGSYEATAVLLFQEDLEELEDALLHSVFRGEASQLPPEPYVQRVMVYDGALVAVDLDGLAFITSAAWLKNAAQIELLHEGERYPLVLERSDGQNDLALLRPAREWDWDVTPLQLAQVTPDHCYALLSPETPYQQLVRALILNARGPGSWTTSITAINGYPLVNAKGELVAIQRARSEEEPEKEGLALGWPQVKDFLDPEEDPDRAKAREPDRIQEGPFSR